MRSPRILRCAAALVALVLIAMIVVGAPPARAASSAPGWTVGDHWSYVSNTGEPSTIAVVGRENVVLAGGTYDTFHTTWTVSAVVTREEWVRMADLGIAKTVTRPFNIETITTYDPPLTQAAFPVSLGMLAWSGSSEYRINVGSTHSQGTIRFSGSVASEGDVQVPAGTFHAYAIRNPAPTQIPTAYTLSYYSDAVGYWVKQESYDGQDRLLGSLTLTAYSYQTAAIGTALLVVVVILIVVAVLVLLWWKRKQSMGKPGGPAYRPTQPAPQNPPSQPYNPPYNPPQQPPQGP